MTKCNCSRSFSCPTHSIPTPRERALRGPADRRNRKRRETAEIVKPTVHPLDSVG
jgi:hypothetical protein